MAHNKVTSKVTIDHLSKVWIEMPPVSVLPLQTLNELVSFAGKRCRPILQGCRNLLFSDRESWNR